MAGRSRSPLAFIAPPALRSFGPSSFAPQQFPLHKSDVGAEHSGSGDGGGGAQPSSSAEYQAFSSLQEKYELLLSHERQAKELGRSIWETERQLYLSRIAVLESTVEDLHGQLDKCQSGKAVMRDFPERLHTGEVTAGGLGGELMETHDEGFRGDGVEPVVTQLPAPEHAVPRADSPPVEDLRDEATRADSPGPPEYPYPKTPKSVKGDVEPDEAEIGNLLDQAGRILGKQPYGIHHYDDEDDFEEDFRLILKPNKNFRSNWAF